jgi:hypothetical protein
MFNGYFTNTIYDNRNPIQTKDIQQYNKETNVTFKTLFSDRFSSFFYNFFKSNK